MKTFTLQARGGFVIKMLVHKKRHVSEHCISASTLSSSSILPCPTSLSYATNQSGPVGGLDIRLGPVVVVRCCDGLSSLSHVTVSVNTGRNQNSVGMYFSLSKKNQYKFT